MMRWLGLACLVVVMSGVGTLFLESYREGDPYSIADPLPIVARPPRPKAVLLDVARFDFGVMPQRTDWWHFWKLMNDGDGDLKIKTEGWTTNSQPAIYRGNEALTLKPGEAVTLKPDEIVDIELVSNSRENNGRYEKGCDVSTNDPRNPIFMLRVAALVTPDLSNPNDGQASESSDRPVAGIHFVGLGR